MTDTTTIYELHPLALLMPAMRPEEYAELRDDIEAHGLAEPITVLEEFEGTEKEARSLVVSLNLHRRQLTTAQLSWALVQLYETEAKRETGRNVGGRPRKPARDSSQVFNGQTEPSGDNGRAPQWHERVWAMAGGEASGATKESIKVAGLLTRAPKTAALVGRRAPAPRAARAGDHDRDARRARRAAARRGGSVTAPQERAKVLREAGLSYRTIADSLGVSSTTVYRWLNPDYDEVARSGVREWKAANRHLTRAYDYEHRHKPCPHCGQPRVRSAGQCQACWDATVAVRRTLVEGMWGAGWLGSEINAALGLDPRSPYVYTRRADGWDLPHRRGPQALANLRASNWRIHGEG